MSGFNGHSFTANASGALFSALATAVMSARAQAQAAADARATNATIGDWVGLVEGQQMIINRLVEVGRQYAAEQSRTQATVEMLRADLATAHMHLAAIKARS